MEPSKWLPAGFSLSGRKSSRIAQSSSFKDFRSRFALRSLSVDLNDGEWKFYEGGRREEPLLLLLPAETGTAESMYRLVLALSSKGYHVIAAQHPPYFSVPEFVSGLDAFLDAVGAKYVHIMGAGMGGLLAQEYSSYRPKRVSSLVLCNSYCSVTSSSSSLVQTAGEVVSPMYQITPAFVLKNVFLNSLRVETIQVLCLSCPLHFPLRTVFDKLADVRITGGHGGVRIRRGTGLILEALVSLLSSPFRLPVLPLPIFLFSTSTMYDAGNWWTKMRRREAGLSVGKRWKVAPEVHYAGSR
eukprot:765074-Hanusia_phi.AAC.1